MCAYSESGKNGLQRLVVFMVLPTAVLASVPIGILVHVMPDQFDLMEGQTFPVLFFGLMVGSMIICAVVSYFHVIFYDMFWTALMIL